VGSVSKEPLFSATVEAAEQRAREARRVADVAACMAWNLRMKGCGGPAQPSPLLGDALNAGYRYLEVKCAGCNTHSSVDISTLRRPRETPIWQLEQRMRCKPCSEQRGYPFKRGYLVRLRRSKLTTKDDGEPWYSGDQRDRN
jgi:hypothetical protein